MSKSPITTKTAQLGEPSTLEDLVYQQTSTQQFTNAPITIEGLEHQEMVFTGKVEGFETVQIEVIAGHTVHQYESLIISGTIDFPASHDDTPFGFTALPVKNATLRIRPEENAKTQEGSLALSA